MGVRSNEGGQDRGRIRKRVDERPNNIWINCDRLNLRDTSMDEAEANNVKLAKAHPTRRLLINTEC